MPVSSGIDSMSHRTLSNDLLRHVLFSDSKESINAIDVTACVFQYLTGTLILTIYTDDVGMT